MKRMRRIASLLLAMAMAFGLTATAFAAEANADDGKVKATVTNETNHSYAAYQIFEGTQEAGNAALGDVGWGSGLNRDGSKLLTALQGDDRFKVGEGGANIFAGFTEAAQVAAALEKYKANPVVAAAFANLADKNRTGAPEAQIAAGAMDVTLPVGYYLLVDTTNLGNGANDALNPALLQVTNNGGITIKKKYEVPTVDKSVTGTDGITGEATDCNIGDSVTFTLTGTLPGDGEGEYDGKYEGKGLDDYETYQYKFTDTLSEGLKYNGGAEVYLYKDGDVGNNAEDNKIEVTSSFAISHDKPNEAGGTLTISIDDLKPVVEDNGGTSKSKIVVVYTAELTAGAVTGGSGNANTVELNYSNNPNAGGQGNTATTPPDKAIVFTYELDGTKVDGKNPDKKLKDAEFVLFRLKKGETGPSYTEVDGKKIPTNVEYALVDRETGKLTGWTESRDDATAETNILKSGETGEFKVKGLDAGAYYLEETKAPAGYNLLKEPVKLTIQAEISQGDDKAKVDPSLTKVEIVTLGADGQEAPAGGNGGNVADGSVELVVQNNAGALLPSTGGMGTTLFYIAGAALVLAAGVLLVMKRRAGAGK